MATKMKNKYKIDGNTLIVYNRKDNKEILFDLDDFDIINQMTWHIHGGRYASARKQLAHRMLLGNPSDKQVDHINGNKLDNRKINLRAISPKENSQNNRRAKGYYWNKQMKRWHVQIAVNGKNKHIGCYKIENEARAAYLEAKKKYHPSAPTHLWQQL